MAELGAQPTATPAGLEGKVVWLTGASRGLGRDIALGLAKRGVSLMLSARSEEGLRSLVGEIRELGGTATSFAGSIAEPEVVAGTINAIEDRFGRLDVLINNAAISPTFVRSEHARLADWQQVLDVNLTAPLACCQAAFPLLSAASAGSIVNVSSIHGTRAQERLIAYAASKGGLEMVTRTLAVEWATCGIRVNAVAPGYIETDMSEGLRQHELWSEKLLSRVPMGRFGTSSEVTPAVLFLAGPEASYITGATLYIDGGWTAL